MRNRDLLGKDALEPIKLLAKPRDVLAECTITHPPNIKALQCIDNARQFVKFVHRLHPPFNEANLSVPTDTIGIRNSSVYKEKSTGGEPYSLSAGDA